MRNATTFILFAIAITCGCDSRTTSPNANKPQGDLSLALTYLNQGEFDKALAELPEQNDPDIMATRGKILRQAGRYDEATAELNRAIAADSNSAYALTQLAFVLQDQQSDGWAVESEKYLRKAVAIDPDDSTSRALLGQALFDREQYEEAITELTRAIELDPKAFSTYTIRAAALAASGKFDEARQDAKRAKELCPPSVLQEVIWIDEFISQIENSE